MDIFVMQSKNTRDFSHDMNYTNGMFIVFDVVDFKHVNDVYGHVKGDLCLSIIANCIKKAYAKYGYY